MIPGAVISTPYTTRNAQGQAIASGNVTEIVGHYNGSPSVSFLYQFNVTSGGVGGVAQFSVSNYDSFTTDVQQLVAAGQFQQFSVNRNVTGTTIDYNYIPEITNGSSGMLLINTNAPDFGPGSIALQDAGNALVAGFAPVSRVPEPASMIIFATSLLGLGGINLSRRFRLRKAIA